MSSYLSKALFLSAIGASIGIASNARAEGCQREDHTDKCGLSALIGPSDCACRSGTIHGVCGCNTFFSAWSDVCTPFYSLPFYTCEPNQSCDTANGGQCGGGGGGS